MATVAEEKTLCCTIRYRDAHGFYQDLRVTRADARTIRAVRQASRREQQRWYAQHVTFTSLEIDPNEIGLEYRLRASSGYCWEGPKFEFSWLVGKSRTWTGSPVIELDGQRYCTFCWDRLLPSDSYCLGCDRSGRDREIPPPSPDDLKLRRSQKPKDDGLHGGRS